MPILRILDALGLRRKRRPPDRPVPPEPLDHPSLRAMTPRQLADLPIDRPPAGNTADCETNR
ncbi:hypothetical protein [Labrys monachus]|uniref:Uncharacterized protein n=1 Tax=Labrys monachus TaxID=217067 RepID=A0ABU0FL62_9HYPH|nr:hypothetical protein [Labrys monachus]MDQ0395349.1 hypothetical protein [Labrys monachus]